MSSLPVAQLRRPVRVGGVSYLNAKPLVVCLRELAPDAELIEDVPSRLAAKLERGELDVALVSSIQSFRPGQYTVVSDACVAAEGRVRSIQLFSRVPVERIETLALDEGSLTSVALARILLAERFGRRPELQGLPIGKSLDDTDADAVVLIGDRAMRPVAGRFEFIWDLGEQWRDWTGLPMVFALWLARPHVDLGAWHELFSAARDCGVARLAAIAAEAAPQVGLSEQECLSYLRDHLRFRLGARERQGLELFLRLAVRHGLVPSGGRLVFFDRQSA